MTRRARADLLVYLLQPVFAAVVGVAFVASLLASVLDGVGFVPKDLWILGLFYILGFGGVVIGCVARCGHGPKAWLWGLLLATVYAAYSWILWPVLVRATWRQMRSSTAWAKTEREAIVPELQLAT